MTVNKPVHGSEEIERRIEEIRERLSKATNWPWQVEAGDADEWPVCFPGTSNIDGKKYQVSTDGVHASELFGDAKTDAEFIANAPSDIEYLLSLIPSIKQEAYRECAEIARQKGNVLRYDDGTQTTESMACFEITAAITEKSKA